MEMFGPQLGALTVTMKRDEWGLWTLTVHARLDAPEGPAWEEVLGMGPCSRLEAQHAALEVLADVADTLELLPED